MFFNLHLSSVLPFLFLLTPMTLAVTLYPLPPPPGPYNTTFINVPLTETRLDPYAPTPMLRRPMLSIFNPVLPSQCDPILAPYMPVLTAAFYDNSYKQFGVQNLTFEALRLRVCSSSSSNATMTTYPVVLFSPGLTTSRLLSSYLAQSVASNGYTVINIDHPYDAPIITYPDNSTIFAAPELLNDTLPRDVIDKALTIRSGDVLAVIHALINHTLPIPFSPKTKIAIFGQSLGGATALLSIHLSSHLRAGLNMDGEFFSSVALDLPTTKPFLIFGRTNNTLSTEPSWNKVWPLLQGPKWDIELADSVHETFTDLPLVAEVLNLFPGGAPTEIVALIGSLNGMRALEVIGTYVSAFMGFAIGGKGVGLLAGDNGAFPEVTFRANRNE